MKLNKNKYELDLMEKTEKAIKEANNSVLNGKIPDKEEATKQFIKSVYKTAATLHTED